MTSRHVLGLSAALTLALVFSSAALATAAVNVSGLSYRSVGPAISTGRTTAVVGSDADPLFYLTGGADGGVFKSTDGGSIWTPIFDRADAAAIGVIAVAPNDDQNIWIGTGESNPRNDVAMGDGIWHSSDGGKTWKHLGLQDAGAISSISIDPEDPQRIVVGVLGQVFRDSNTRGAYLSTDGGSHWTRTLFIGPSTGVSSLIRLPDRPQTLFAGLWEIRREPWTLISGGESGGIFRSDDGGKSWRKLNDNGLPPSPTGRIGLTAKLGGRIYAIIQSKAGDLWRSDNWGATWRLMPHSHLVGPRPFYFSSIAADPADSQRLISVGLLLAMSSDGGRTFHQISPNAGSDFHVVWWSRDGKRIAVGSDYGFSLSTDGAKKWSQPYNLPFSQPYHVGFDAAIPNYHVCVGLQDTNSWCGVANSDSGLGVLNRDWWTVVPGDGMWAEYDPLDSRYIWSTSTNNDNGQVYIWNSSTRQAYEVSPVSGLGYVPAYMLRYRFNWDTPLAFASDGRAFVGGNVVFQTADRGQHWTVISKDLTRNDKSHQQLPGGPIDADLSGAETSDTILCIAPSSIENSTLWVGTDDGLVQVTRDNGGKWFNVTPPQAPHWGRVAIEASRFDRAKAFAAFDDHMLGDDAPHLYVTQDFGAHWRSISGDLPDSLFVRTVRQDPVNANLLYAGTQRGVWASWDGGTHWRSLRFNMPATAIYDIEIQTQMNDLVVASHGRGVWILDDLRPLQQFSWTNAGAITLFAPRVAYRWWQWAPINAFQGNALPDNVFAGPNVAYGALITYWLGPGKHGPATIDILDDRGRTIRRLSGHGIPHAAGFNRTAWDLAEQGPVKWLHTFKENQGPSTGAEVLPGTYTVRLRVDGQTQAQQVAVNADPRDPLSEDAMRLRHQILSALYAQVSDVDSMLNVIDRRLPGALAPQRRAALLALHEQLTSDPKNVEDLSVIPTDLRNQLLDLINRMSETSFQAPTDSQLDTAAALHVRYSKLLERYRSFSL